MKVKAPSAPDAKQFRLDVPFRVKSFDEQSGDIVLEGYASTFAEDRDGETIEPDAFAESLPAYLADNPILLWQHETDWAIGVVTDATLDNVGLKVRAVVTRPEPGELPEIVTAYNKIKRGVVRTFSIGGYFWRELRGDFENPTIVITKVELLEISVVSIPCNAPSMFLATVKAANLPWPSGAGRDSVLTPYAQKQMVQLLGLAKMDDDELEAMNEGERSERYHELAALYERAGCVPPMLDGYKRVIAEVLRDGDLRDDVEVEALKRVATQSARLLVQAVGGIKRPDDERTRERKDAVGGDAEATFDARARALELLIETQNMLVSDLKRGRTLSSTNEGKIREAVTHLQDVLKSVEADAEDDAGEGDGDGDGAAGHGDSMLGAGDLEGKGEKPPKLRAGSDAKSCSSCKHWKKKDGQGPGGWCGKHDYPTGPDQVSDDYAAKKSADYNLSDDDAVDRAEAHWHDDKRALPVADLPFAARDASWDAGAARSAVKGWASSGDSVDLRRYDQAFLWVDDDAGDNLSGRRFIVATADGGTLKYVPRGIFAAANVLQGGRGGSNIPAAGQAALKRSVERLYARMRSEFGDDSITVPWAGD